MVGLEGALQILGPQNGWFGRVLKAHPTPTIAVGWLPPPDQAARGLIHGFEHLQEYECTDPLSVFFHSIFLSLCSWLCFSSSSFFLMIGLVSDFSSSFFKLFIEH